MDQWTHLWLNSGEYIIKLDPFAGDDSDSTFTCWLSDFKSIWSESISTKEDLFKRVSNENPTLSLHDDIKEQLIDAVSTAKCISQGNEQIVPDTDDIDLLLEYSLPGNESSVKFRWILKKCGSQELFDQITKPLLRQTRELEKQKKQLIDIAQRKDDEIKQYKFEGAAELKRKKFITAEFKDTEFTPQSQMFDSEIFDQFQSIIGPLAKKEVKDDNAKDNDNPNSSAMRVAIVQHTSPRGRRNQRKPMYKRPIRQGVTKYDSDSDEGDSITTPKKQKDANKEDDDGPNNASKRIRLDSDC